MHTSHSSNNRLAAWLLLPLLALCFSGCLTAKAKIDSTPQGATVYFDSHRLPEVTPTEVEVDWYGGHKITLIKEGYERHTEIVEIKAPPYLWIPLDLGATLIPYNFEDGHSYHYELTPSDGAGGAGEQ